LCQAKPFFVTGWPPQFDIASRRALCFEIAEVLGDTHGGYAAALQQRGRGQGFLLGGISQVADDDGRVDGTGAVRQERMPAVGS